MKRVIAITSLVAASMLTGGTAAWADEPDPPNRTGCCFSFDDSPVNIIFCAVPGACQFTEGD